MLPCACTEPQFQLLSVEAIERWAIFSPDRRYRYELGRRWDGSRPGVAFNAAHIERALARVKTVVACWGNSEVLRTIPQPLKNMKEQIDDAHLWPPMSFGTNADGSPLHPLERGKHRIPDDFEPVSWRQPGGLDEMPPEHQKGGAR